MNDLAARFTEYPETIQGDVTPAFIEFVMKIHPSAQPYDSASVALMCRQAFELGRREAQQSQTH
jgi:hypothetical protein